MNIEAYGLSVTIDLGDLTITRYVETASEISSTVEFYQSWWSQFDGNQEKFKSALLTQTA